MRTHATGGNPGEPGQGLGVDVPLLLEVDGSLQDLRAPGQDHAIGDATVHARRRQPAGCQHLTRMVH